MSSLPQLYGTPLSHFTRKVRIACAELAIAYDFVPIDGVMAPSAAHYAGNPLMRIPTLVDGDITVFDSDHIARYLVARAGGGADPLGVRSERVDDVNRLAVVNGIMANEVVPILAARGGLDITGAVYFTKLFAAIASGLAWLEARAPADAAFDYRTIATICAWQHLVHYRLVDLAPYPRLAALVAQFASRPSVAASAPPGQ